MPDKMLRSDPELAFQTTVERLIRSQPSVEVRRLEFLEERVGMFDEAERVARLVEYLRSSCPGDKTPRTIAFLEWADAHVGNLRDNCSPARLENDLVSSGLW